MPVLLLIVKENIALTKPFNLKVNCSHFENSLDMFLATKIIDKHKKMSVATQRCNIYMNGESFKYKMQCRATYSTCILT